jgi:4-amino-4-deoxy-L-arabinose transferase-like glycosyltransferase
VPHTPPLVRLAVVAILVSSALLAAAFALSHPLFGVGGDEMAHFDYAYQVWHGHLPVFEHGLVVEPPWGNHPPTQWTSQHPPLFYLIEAPFVGPLVDHGHYAAAGYAARAVSAVIATGLTAAVLWLGREVAPSRTALWLTAGLVAAVNPPVVIFGGSVYNDNLMVAFSTLLLAVTVRMLRRGPTVVTLLLFGLFTAGALWTRASALLPVGLCGLALGLSWLVRRRPRWRALLGLGCVSLLAVASIAWFYLRNQRLTGNLAGARLGEELRYLQNRQARPVQDVLLDPSVWRNWHSAWGYAVVPALWAAALLVAVPLLVAGVLAVVRLLRTRRSYEVWTVLILAGLLVGIVLIQADYTANRGGTSWRYMKPQLPAIALGVAWTLTASRRLAVLLLPTWVLAAVLPLAADCVRRLIVPSAQSAAPLFPVATSAALTLGVAAVSVAITAILLLPRAGAGWAPRGSNPEPAD